MITQKMSAKDARDNFTDLLGSVYYGNESIVVEKKGRPFAVVINPSEYENYQTLKQAAKKRFLEIVEEIRAANKGKKFDDVYKDVTEIVKQVRKERYAEGK